MPGMILRMLITALGLWLASEIVDGIEFESTSTLLAAAILLLLAPSGAKKKKRSSRASA